MLSWVPETVGKVRMAGGGRGVSGSSGPFVVELCDVTCAGQLTAAPVGVYAPPSRFI